MLERLAFRGKAGQALLYRQVYAFWQAALSGRQRRQRRQAGQTKTHRRWGRPTKRFREAVRTIKGGSFPLFLTQLMAFLGLVLAGNWTSFLFFFRWFFEKLGACGISGDHRLRLFLCFSQPFRSPARVWRL